MPYKVEYKLSNIKGKNLPMFIVTSFRICVADSAIKLVATIISERTDPIFVPALELLRVGMAKETIVKTVGDAKAKAK